MIATVGVWVFWTSEFIALMTALSVAGGLAVGILIFWLLRSIAHWLFG